MIRAGWDAKEEWGEGMNSRHLCVGAVLFSLAITACAPILSTPSPPVASPPTTATSPTSVAHDWPYLEPPSAPRFTEYLDARYPELRQRGARLLWAADSEGAKAPDRMSLPDKGHLLVEIACTGGSHRLEVAAMRDGKRVFWLMTDTCREGTLYSGEKPFDDVLDARLALTSARGTQYVAAAYFIPDPTS
jgi:hypothetical protein